MRTGLIRAFAILVLLLTIGGHISEIFDHWDHTLTTGREADYTVVILGASIGALFLTLAIRFFSPPRRQQGTVERATVIGQLNFDLLPVALLSPSPPKLSSLRI